MKKAWRYIGGINGLLLILYFVFVFTTHLITGEYLSWGFSKQYFLTFFAIIVGLSVVICPLVFQFLSKATIRSDRLSTNKATLFSSSVIFYITPFSLLLLFYLAYYPGGFSLDSINQYTQAVNNVYNDWHPVIQTLFAFKLPLSLTGGWSGSIVLFQILCFSAVLGYSLDVISKYTNRNYAILSMLFVLLNPQTGNICMFPWKDISFAIGALLLLTYSLQIYISKGTWLNALPNLVMYIITGVLTTLIRHNALLFTVPLVVASLFYCRRKQSLIICISIAAMCLGIKYPLYSALDVEQPNERKIETLGLPMTVIGASVTYAPYTVDEETLDFAYKVAPKEVWEEKYVYGNFNEVKWDSKTNTDVIEEYGTKKVLSMMLGCFRDSGKESLTALIKLTRAVYTVTDGYNHIHTPSIMANDFNIELDSNQEIYVVLTNFCNFMLNNFPHLFSFLGIEHLLLIASVLAKCNFSHWEDWKKFLFILPVLSYNFGTSLLLTSFIDSIRFFFYTFTLMPVLLVFLYRNDSERSTDDKVLITE